MMSWKEMRGSLAAQTGTMWDGLLSQIGRKDISDSGSGVLIWHEPSQLGQW